MEKDRKVRLLESLKWARLMVGLVGAILLLYEVVQKYRGLEGIFDYYEVASTILGIFCILLAGEQVVEGKKGITHQFLFVYGVLMIIITFIT